MSFINWANLDFIHFIWAVIPVTLIIIYSFLRKKKALEAFAHIEALKHISINVSRPLQILKSAMIILAIIFLVLSLMRPQGSPTEEKMSKEGRDVAFLIDVSKSMLAEDLKPNRLENAKLAISDLVNHLDGDRIALMVFAGDTALKCPLTHDYNFFLNALNSVSVNDVSKGGTYIGTAITRSMETIFQEKHRNYMDIILITDGEDQDSFPKKAAEKASKQGIKIHTIGLGSPAGSKIPVKNESGDTVRYIEDEGKPHRSKLDIKSLQEISMLTNGKCIPVKTGYLDLVDIYDKTISKSKKKEHTSGKTLHWEEWFQFFLAISIILIIAEAIIPEKKRIKQSN